MEDRQARFEVLSTFTTVRDFGVEPRARIFSSEVRDLVSSFLRGIFTSMLLIGLELMARLNSTELAEFSDSAAMDALFRGLATNFATSIVVQVAAYWRGLWLAFRRLRRSWDLSRSQLFGADVSRIIGEIIRPRWIAFFRSRIVGGFEHPDDRLSLELEGIAEGSGSRAINSTRETSPYGYSILGSASVFAEGSLSAQGVAGKRHPFYELKIAAWSQPVRRRGVFPPDAPRWLPVDQGVPIRRAPDDGPARWNRGLPDDGLSR